MVRIFESDFFASLRPARQQGCLPALNNFSRDNTLFPRSRHHPEPKPSLTSLNRKSAFGEGEGPAPLLFRGSPDVEWSCSGKSWAKQKANPITRDHGVDGDLGDSSGHTSSAPRRNALLPARLAWHAPWGVRLCRCGCRTGKTLPVGEPHQRGA